MAIEIYGNVASGFGKGALFTELDWAKKQFTEKLGIVPFPGTLNLHLSDDNEKSKWKSAKTKIPHTVKTTDENGCDANCYPVFINDQYLGAIVVPQIDNYPDDRIEIISPLPLREKLSLQNNDRLKLSFNHQHKASTIIFDLDGTLLDTVEAFYILAKETGDEFGIEMNRSHVYNLLNHGKPYWEVAIPESSPNRQEKMDKLNKLAIKLWPEIMAKHACVFPKVLETLQSLKDKDITLGIVTGSGMASVEFLYSAGVEKFFDAVVTNADVSRRKPHPDGLLKCLEMLKVEASDAIYVGDSSIDMQACRSAGMTAIAVLSGAGDSAALCEAGAHRILSDHNALINILN